MGRTGLWSSHIDLEQLSLRLDHLKVHLVFVHANCEEGRLAPDVDFFTHRLPIVREQESSLVDTVYVDIRWQFTLHPPLKLQMY